MDYLSSMFIDNEMDLDEKKRFVEKVRSDRAFYTQTLDLLTQDRLLQKHPVVPEPLSGKKWRPPIWISLARGFKPLGFAAAGFAAAVLMLFAVFQALTHRRADLAHQR